MKKKLNTSVAVLFLIMLVAFLVRATYNRLDYMSEGAPDQYGYENSQVAASVATGHGFDDPYPLAHTGPTAQQPPGYIYLLAGIYREFGVRSATSYLVATTLNALFSTMVCIPIFLIGRRVAGAAVGLASAACWAVFPSAIEVATGSLGVWPTALSALLAAFVLLATLRVRETDRAGAWLAYGLLFAIAVEVNPTILSVVPFLVAWLAWQLYVNRRRWLRLPALAVLFAVLGCVPWAIRNWITFHHPIPFRSDFGLELWLGNNQYEDHDLFSDFRDPFTNLTETRQMAEIGEVAFMREKQTEAMRFIMTHRWETLHSVFVRYAVTWIGVPVRLSAFWPALPWSYRIAFIFNALIAILGWAGMWAMVREHHPLRWPFLAYLIFYPAVYYVTHAALRYRHPIDPALAVLSVFAVYCAARAVAGQFGAAAEAGYPTARSKPYFALD